VFLWGIRPLSRTQATELRGSKERTLGGGRFLNWIPLGRPAAEGPRHLQSGIRRKALMSPFLTAVFYHRRYRKNRKSYFAGYLGLAG